MAVGRSAGGGQAQGGGPRPAPPRVAVKICGVADVASAVLSAELGADYLGLNFWPGSPRRIDLGRAREIAAAARAAAPGVALVGVFVNPAAREVEEAAAAVGLDLLQFSGDEPPAAVLPFAERAIKALRTHDAGAVAAYAGCWGLLFDTPRAAAAPAGPTAPAHAAPAAPTVYGGTGRAWDYGEAMAAMAALGAMAAPGTPAAMGAMGVMAAPAAPGSPATTTPAAGRRVFLAGGLGPDNVRRVVATLRPFAVDVCSRVETAPGRKDPRLLRQLFEEVSNGQATTAT